MMRNGWRSSIALLVLVLAVTRVGAPGGESAFTVDATAPTRPFPRFWERMFGSGRAALTLRDSYREDLRAVRSVTAVAYIRFHAIFHDELGVYTEAANGESIYNFSYVDQVYDGLLANGVRPFDEVSRWYFEVWNEPNLDFWGGAPKQSTYWTLYDHTARGLKAVDARLRVGGPATAQAAWVPAFIQHCRQNGVPVDFISTHVYGDDTAKNIFGSAEPIARDRMVCRAVQKVHAEIQTSPLPSLPLIWSEFNASFANHPQVTDAPYMGPWLAETVRQCDGLVQDMSYWTFSDVFEEGGVVKTPFYGGFGLLAAGGIPKPAFNAFALLHQLGEERFPADAEGALLTRRSDGAVVLAVWNYAEIGSTPQARRVVLTLKNIAARTASVQSLDAEHGNVHPAYQRMGSPRYPTQRQLAELRAAAALPAPVVRPLEAGALSLEIPPDGLVLVTIAAAPPARK